VIVEAPKRPLHQPDHQLGIDLSIGNLAADADGRTYSGGPLKGLCTHPVKLDHRSQNKGTKSAQWWLKRKRRRKTKRFAVHENHRIANHLVATTAQDTRCGTIWQDLTGMRDGIPVKKAQRLRQRTAMFYQIRSFISDTVCLAGVPMALVDLRNTSRTCPHGGLTDTRIFDVSGLASPGPPTTLLVGRLSIRQTWGTRPQMPASGGIVDCH
jgi:transposase